MPKITLPLFKDVFHSYNIKGLSDWDDLPILGRLNLKILLTSLRRREKRATSDISTYYDKSRIFFGHMGSHFKRLASAYDNPEVELGRSEEGWYNGLEPIDLPSLVRKAGSTTFNICGWCTHNSGGTYRYDCALVTRCGLLPDKYDEDYDGLCVPNTEDSTAITTCHLHTLSLVQCTDIAKWYKSKAEGAFNAREDTRVAIKHVQQLIADAIVDKPYLINLRPSDWFNVGDEIVFNLTDFVSDDADIKLLVEDTWVRGIVVPGYRHHDGCVSCGFDVRVHTGSNLNGRGGGAGSNSPYVLKVDEYEYLKKAADDDLEFLDLWLNSILEEYSVDQFDAAQYTIDLRAGTVAEK